MFFFFFVSFFWTDGMDSDGQTKIQHYYLMFLFSCFSLLSISFIITTCIFILLLFRCIFVLFCLSHIFFFFLDLDDDDDNAFTPSNFYIHYRWESWDYGLLQSFLFSFSFIFILNLLTTSIPYIINNSFQDFCFMFPFQV